MKYRSSTHAYETAIDAIDKEINDVELSTVLFIEATKAYFGDAEESLKLIDSVHSVYLQLRKEGWERERAIQVGVPVAVACYVKDKEERENLFWFIVYAILAVLFAALLSTKVPLEF